MLPCLFSRPRKQLKDGKIFRSSADHHVYLMPGSLRSSGEDSGGWLESCFTRQADRESQVQDPELEIVTGWKSRQRARAPPSFRMVRVPSPEMQDAISKYFDGTSSSIAMSPMSIVFLLNDVMSGAMRDALSVWGVQSSALPIHPARW